MVELLAILLAPVAILLSILTLGHRQPLKRILGYVYLRILRYFSKRRLDLYNYASDDPYNVGYFIPPIEKELESPQSEAHLQNSCDEVFCYGINSKSEYLIVRVARACNSASESWVYLKLANGKTYSLPKQNPIFLNAGDPDAFVSGGLKLLCLSPFRRWRVFFNGILRETTNGQKDEEEKFVHVKFSFVWTASSDVYDSNIDLDSSLLATAMSKEHWKMPFPPVGRFQEVVNCYEQGGMLLGTVTVEGETEKEIYLWGVRARFLGQVGNVSGTATHIFGTAKNGSLFHVSSFSMPNIVKDLHSGFIVQSDSRLFPVNSCYMPPAYNESDKEMKVKFSAGTKSYSLTVNTSDLSTDFSSSHGWTGGISAKYVTFTLNDFTGCGVVMTANLTESKPKSTFEKMPKIIKEPRTNLVLPLCDHQCQLVEVSGGKGSSLAILTDIANNGKFIVPQGVVVTTAAYKEFMRGYLLDVVADVEAIAWKHREGNLETICQRAVEEISKGVMPDIISSAIHKALLRHYGENLNVVTFAVRSSATGEDSDQMSCAGQMDTILGVKGFGEILSAVKKCWASQFSFVATGYKRRYGQLIDMPMAVVIQEMVPCDVAGVMFTCDPVTSDPSLITITANYGLGESVVSASEEPDTIILKRDINNQLSILSTTVGSKKTKIVVNESSGGTVQKNLSEEDSTKCCISGEKSHLLAKIGIMVEEKFSTHRDIEWGMVGNLVYLLQSRPVTSLDVETEFEIRHEFDSFMRQEEEYFSKANVGEVMPGAMSPFGLNFLMKTAAVAFMHPDARKIEQDNFDSSPYFPKGLVTIQNHMLFNLIDSMFRWTSERPDEISNMNKSNMIAMFGRILDDEEMLEIARERHNRKTSRIVKLKQTFYILRNIFMAGHYLEHTLKQFDKYTLPFEDTATSQELFYRLALRCTEVRQPFQRHMECSMTSSVWNLTLLSVLANARGEWNSEVYSDFALVLATCTNVESADVPAAIQSLAHRISQDIEPSEFKKKTAQEALEWLQTTTLPSGTMFRDFLRKHGHRCLKEFDMDSLTWGMDPKPLAVMLQGYVGSVTSSSVEKSHMDTKEVLSKLHIPLTWKTRLFLKFLLPKCRKGVQLREKSKSLLIKSYNEFRKAFWHTAHLMVKEGRLPDPKLLFYLTIEETCLLLSTRSPWLINKAIRRLRAHPEMDSLRFPEISKGIPTFINVNEKVVGDGTLLMKGVPVSQGVIIGTARVINSLQEATSIQQGDILITYSTDIGWSPYFPLLSGVVTELGGLISHGAVVAREYGLPCVVGLHGATQTFSSGDMVRLDGNAGTLEKMNSSST